MPGLLDQRRSTAMRLSRPVRCVLLISASWFGLCGALHTAAAQGNSAAAEALFREGRDLLEQGKIEEACPKLAESQRLEPATGTLLGLAMCHEQQGKLASAWAEFVEAEALARRERQTDREEFARARALELQPRLSQLTISLDEAAKTIDGLVVRRDGVVVGSGAYGLSTPMDGGQHHVEAQAPGRIAYEVTVELAAEGDSKTVMIPELESAPLPAAANTKVPASGASARDTEAGQQPVQGWTPMQWGGVGAAGAGVVSLGLGGWFLLSALEKDEESAANCEGDRCNSVGVAARQRAIDDGGLATAFGIGGLVLLGAGATLYFVGDGSPASDATSVSVASQVGGAKLQVVGSF